MAVLTAIDEQDAGALLEAYGLGPPRRIDGIAAGSVNSNFALQAERRWFLRLYEEQDLDGALRETAMLEGLARAGVPTPPPVPRIDGRLVSVVRGKPAALFPWRDGTMRCQASVTPADTRKVGQALARVHLAGQGQAAQEGRFRLVDLFRRVDQIATDPQFRTTAPVLRSALERVNAMRDPELYRGLTHGDLFRDNVLWRPDGEIAALLDFESACLGTYAYDLMVTILSWCFGDDLDAALACAMREGYEGVRPLDEAERRGLWAEGAFGALRFAVTRITDYAMRTGAHGPRVVKDWRRFMKRFDRLEALGPEGLRAMLA